MLLALPILIACVWLVLASATRREMLRMPRLVNELPQDGARPRVLAIVPARDEAEVVERCLKALLIQQGVDMRVVLYDDRSSDQTRTLARDIAEQNPDRLTVIAGSHEPPPGWCGKPHAIIRALEAAGYDIAGGTIAQAEPPDLLLFVDADVVLRPCATAGLAFILHHRRAGLASALPHLVCKSFWEKVAGPSIAALVTARAKPSLVHRMGHPAVLANGQFMMLTPEAYARVGGHAAVKAEVLEDVALARRVKKSGLPIVLADGQDVVATRMYASLGELFDGWVKNAFALVGGTVRQALTYALLGLWLAWTPFLCLVAGLVSLVNGYELEGAVLVGGWALSAMSQMRIRRFTGQSPAHALFAPLGSVVLAAVLMKATWHAVRKTGVTWKGRSYVDGVGIE